MLAVRIGAAQRPASATGCHSFGAWALMLNLAEQWGACTLW